MINVYIDNYRYELFSINKSRLSSCTFINNI